MASKDLSKKKFFTTGQIAKICGVSIATVQKWIDAGEINSYRLPLTASERRVPRDSLLTFMKKYKVPTDEIEEERGYRVLVLEQDEELRGMVRQAWDDVTEKPKFLFTDDATEALLEAGAFKPNMMVMDLKLWGADALRTVGYLRKNNIWKDTALVIVTDVSDEEKNRLEELKVDAIAPRSVKPPKLKKTLLKAAGIA